MNIVILMGRLTRDPETRYAQGDNALAISRYTLAIDRRFKRKGEQEADFIPCVAFGKSAEFADKYFKQGTRVAVTGRIQTGSYTNREGKKVYTTEIVIETQEFAESRAETVQNASGRTEKPHNEESTGAGERTHEDEFMALPEGIDEDLPFA